MSKANPIPDYGELIDLKSFVNMCRYGAIVNDDGSGYYSDGTSYFREEYAVPSDLYAGRINTKYTHVMWFSK